MTAESGGSLYHAELHQTDDTVVVLIYRGKEVVSHAFVKPWDGSYRVYVRGACVQVDLTCEDAAKNWAHEIMRQLDLEELKQAGDGNARWEVS